MGSWQVQGIMLPPTEGRPGVPHLLPAAPGDRGAGSGLGECVVGLFPSDWLGYKEGRPGDRKGADPPTKDLPSLSRTLPRPASGAQSRLRPFTPRTPRPQDTSPGGWVFGMRTLGIWVASRLRY